MWLLGVEHDAKRWLSLYDSINPDTTLQQDFHNKMERNCGINCTEWHVNPNRIGRVYHE